MKLRGLDWLIIFVKSVVSALLLMLFAIGLLLLTEVRFHTVNWLKEIEYIVTHDVWDVVIVVGAMVLLWLWLIHFFYERALLAVIASQIGELRHHILTPDATGLDQQIRVKRLRPMVENVNGLFTAAQTAMTEEREIERSKDEMIANVSHDLRTPLTSILGYLGLVKNNPGNNLSKQDITKYTNTAFAKAEQMRSLVEDLFDYTQVAQVDFKLRWAPLDLTAMLNQLAVNYELEAEDKAVVITAITNQTSIQMVGDPDRLARVFMNLISNALKYGDGATFIRLTAKVLPDNQVEVRVQNNGEQIPEDALSRLFDRFYRVESSRNLKTGGTGLGLAIVSGIVDAHGGTIRVESDAQMTSFIVRLPMEPTQ
ncbi:MAG: HAMP domain-containing histidine kinase [Lactobacillaceae bacterium]|jgi:signal transduction histidine kinase|nr:HAMP domain-containing histidine kinase [Lactobacillaceae bacterium]